MSAEDEGVGLDRNESLEAIAPSEEARPLPDGIAVSSRPSSRRILIVGATSVAVGLLVGAAVGFLGGRLTAPVPTRVQTCLTVTTGASSTVALTRLMSVLEKGPTPLGVWSGPELAGKTRMFALFTNHQRAVGALQVVRRDHEPDLFRQVRVAEASCASD